MTICRPGRKTGDMMKTLPERFSLRQHPIMKEILWGGLLQATLSSQI